MNSNADWRRRSLAAVWHPCTQMKLHAPEGADVPLIPVTRAEGVWLHDADGGRYLDAISSWWVNLFGHNHPAIRAALTDQLQRLDHVMLAGFTHAPVVELSERLAALTGLGHAFYGSDGASATEIALKMSAHHWRNAGQPAKNGFVSVAGGYHGETVGALAVTDIALFREAYAPLVRLAHTVPSPDARAARGDQTAADVAHLAADAAERWLAEHHATTAAMIVEPLVQCASGMAMHHPVYLQRLRAACSQWQVHLVLDEIAVGFGRTGSLFAHQQAGIQPDFLCLSKGLTGGTLPLSVVLCTDAVYGAFYDDEVARGFLHSHSYTGNPLACRAALATLDLFDETNALVANQASASHLAALFEPLSTHARVRHARQQGMIFAWDVASSLPDFARRYSRAALARGLVLRPIGHTLYAMPPYVMNETEMAHLATGALAALNDTLAQEQGGDAVTQGVMDAV
ncbi:adenosylmethionine--8-amino-7-oxononanoate transaminase [Ideonella margarita]|uniref:Adenosylmethionine-8-amino-7-oxononanoate aminotransferase n=1 Tax=Ideonella margarita TaxID=2984191 RepID=A0ABU9BZQ3_9BURK